MGMKCAGAQYKVSGECSTGGSCTVRGEISGTLPSAPKGEFAAMMAAVVGSVDAGSFTLDVSDSTVVVPAMGYVTVKRLLSGIAARRTTRTWTGSQRDLAMRWTGLRHRWVPSALPRRPTRWFRPREFWSIHDRNGSDPLRWSSISPCDISARIRGHGKSRPSGAPRMSATTSGTAP